MRLLKNIVAIALFAGGIGYLGYAVVYRPYFQVPREDIEFLEGSPTKEQVLLWFEFVGEELEPGEKFPKEGGRQSPERYVTGSAFAVTRRDGRMIYLFFDSAEKLEAYYVVNL